MDVRELAFTRDKERVFFRAVGLPAALALR
jgi:hypothetical protein